MRLFLLLASVLMLMPSVGFAQQCGTCLPMFSSNPGAPIDIGPTSAVVTDNIVISDTTGTIADLNIYLDISHSYVGDLNISLSHLESGQSTELFFGNISGCAGTDIDVVLDDELANFITCSGGAVPAVGGCYRSDPLPGLTSFNGVDISGTWMLTVRDASPAIDAGVLNGWCLMPTLEVTQGYCEASGCNQAQSNCENSCADDDLNTYISAVSVSNLDNISTLCSATSPGYSDFTADTTLTASFEPGTTYAIDVQISSTNSTVESEFVAAWIDFNHDKVFDDVSEAIYLTYNASTGTYSNSAFLIPTDAILGQTRMRIRDAYNNYPLFADDPARLSCGSSTYGEVEDYTVFIIEEEETDEPPSTPNCATFLSPADIASGMCQKGVSFAWEDPTNGPEPQGYHFYLGTDESAKSVYDSIDLGSSNSFILPDSVLLEKGTRYYWLAVPYDENGAAENCASYSFSTAESGDPLVGIFSSGSADYQQVVCLGTSASLAVEVTGSGGYEYSWTGADIDYLSDTTAAQVGFNPEDVGNNFYEVHVTDRNRCTGSDSVAIDVQETAVAGDIQASSTALCYDETALLSLSGHQGNIVWQQQTGGTAWQDISNEIKDTLNLTPPITHERYRAILSIGSCTDTSEVIELTLFPEPRPATISSETGNFWFCENDSLLLQSNQTNSRWNTESSSQEIYVSQPGNYSVVYTDVNNCTAQPTSVSVMENPTPVKPKILEAPAGQGAINFCEGESVTLSTDAQAQQYSWSNIAPGTSQQVTVSAPVTTRLRVFDEFGCTNVSDPLTLTLRLKPETPFITSVGGRRGLCPNEVITLIANNEPGTDFVWNHDPSITSTSIQVTQPGTFSITASTVYNCSSQSNPFTVTTYNNPPKPTVVILDEPQFCEGKSTRLTTPTNLDVYWNNDPEITDKTITVAQSGNYFVTAMQNGCETNSDPVQITTIPNPPKPNITVSPNRNELCDGEEAVLTTDAIDEIIWINDISNNTNSLTVTESGNYHLRVTNSSGCQSFSDTLTVAFQPLPEKPLIQVTDGILFCLNPNGSFNYQWLDAAGAAIPGENTTTYQDAPEGQFSLRVTNPQTGCTNVSDQVTDIIGHHVKSSVRIFPNPVSSGAKIQWEGMNANTFLLTNQLGQVIRSSRGSGMETSGLAPGIYVLIAVTESTTVSIGKVTVL